MTQLAHAVSGRRRHVEMVAEGAEPHAFWKAMGGRQEYASAEYLGQSGWTPRLFEFSFVTGGLEVERIWNFSQFDLRQEFIYVLDVFHEIYVRCMQ